MLLRRHVRLLAVSCAAAMGAVAWALAPSAAAPSAVDASAVQGAAVQGAAVQGAAVRGAAVSRSTPSTPGASYEWSRAGGPALEIGGTTGTALSAVLAPGRPGGSWLVTGTRTATDGSTTAMVWTSPDGLRWQGVVLAGLQGRALAASTWGTRAVVVGSVGRGPAQRAAAWTSTPGGAWQEVQSVPAFEASDPSPYGPSSPPTTALATRAAPAGAPAGPAPTTAAGAPTTPVPTTPVRTATPTAATPAEGRVGTAGMDVVGAGTQGIFAAGSVSGHEALWYSTDGIRWVRVVSAERAIDATAGASVASLLVTGNGILAGGSVPDGSHTDGALWASADGINWHRSIPADNPFSGAADHRIDGLVLSTTGSLVAVGAVRPGSTWTPATWVSPNGGTWSEPSQALPESDSSLPAPWGSEVRAVAGTSTSDTLEAVGGADGVGRMWTSTDGLDWTEVELPGGLLGPSGGLPGGFDADLVATDGPTTVVADGTPGRPVLLTRVAGRWQRIVPPDAGSAGAEATTAGLVDRGGTLVLAVDVAGEAPGAAEPTSDVVMLGSSDGTDWQRLASGGPLAGAHVDALTDVGGSLVASGWTYGPASSRVAALWTSGDGRHWSLRRLSAAEPSVAQAATTAVGDGATALAAGVGVTDGAPSTAGSAGSDFRPAALDWTTSRVGPVRSGLLDTVAPLGREVPLGSCTDGSTVVVVGEGARTGIPTATGSRPAVTTTTLPVTGTPAGPDGQAPDGTVARAWARIAGTWSSATISPVAGAGSEERMSGCAPVASGFVAWGATTGSQGTAVPALWSSTDGSTWILEVRPTLGATGAGGLSATGTGGPGAGGLGSTGALGATGAGGLTALVRQDSTWVAVGGGIPAADGPADLSMPVDDAVGPTPASAAASGPDGAAVVWSSTDSGLTWVRIATTGAPWAFSTRLSTDQVALDSGTTVVAGQVDGRLAVWTGHPDPTAVTAP